MDRTKYDVLVPIQAQGSSPPLFWAHGLFGDSLSLSTVARRMDPEQPIYGMHAIGLQPDMEPDTSIEAMAERYVEAVRSFQPSGPYYLGGYCFGSYIAYEMARQLEIVGEETALLVAVEGSAPEDYHEATSILTPERLEFIWESAQKMPIAYQEFGGWRISDRLRRILRRGGAERKDSDGQDASGRPEGYYSDRYLNIRHKFFSAPPVEQQKRLAAINRQAMSAYRPEPYGGTLTLFRGRFKHLKYVFAEGHDPKCGWGTLANKVSVHYIDGSHRSCLTEPYVEDLAAQFTNALRAAQVMQGQQ